MSCQFTLKPLSTAGLWQQRTLCIGTQHCIAAPRALHCIAGRVERWATLAPPSFVIIARSARSASGVLHLEKSVISCSTAPQLPTSFQLQSLRLLCPAAAPTQFQSLHASLEVRVAQAPILSDALLPEFLESNTHHYLSAALRIGHLKQAPSQMQPLLLCSLRPAFSGPLAAPWARQTLNSCLLTGPGPDFN